MATAPETTRETILDLMAGTLAALNELNDLISNPRADIDVMSGAQKDKLQAYRSKQHALEMALMHRIKGG